MSGFFQGIGDTLSNIFSFLWDLPGNILDGIGNLFNSLWDWLDDIWTSIKDIPQNIINLLKDLLIYLFVPEDNYFDNMLSNFSNAINEKIPYRNYINALEQLDDVEVNGISESINISNYYISDTLSISKNKWIDFSIFDRYKETWYTWTRVIIYILFIIYNINEIIKTFRGASAVSGSAITISNKTSSNK